jgi:hypothetical protein
VEQLKLKEHEMLVLHLRMFLSQRKLRQLHLIEMDIYITEE